MRGRRKALRLLAAAALVAPAAVVLGGAPASAAGGADCSYTLTISFSTGLNTGSHGGTAGFSYTGVCAQGGAGLGGGGPVPVWESANAYGFGPWNPSGGYSGTCALANIAAPFYGLSGLLVGGSVLVATGSSDAEVDVVTPLLPCSEFSATGAGTAPFVFTSL